MAGRVTIQDIADALGVSRNTVSKAINNTGILADATRDRILQKAVEMGYKQFSYVSLTNISSENPDASKTSAPLLSLSTEETASSEALRAPQPPKASGNIALFTTMFLGNSHFSSTMLDKVQRELASLGYSLTIHLISSIELENLSLPYSFNKETTAGIMCIEVFDPAYSDMICDLGIPTLFIDSHAQVYSPLKADRLLMENRSNICAFVKEMADRGKTRIGFIGEYLHCMSFYERYMAYREALITLGLPCTEEYCILGNKPGVRNPSSQEYQEYLTESIQKLKTLPDVFICTNDFIALDVLQIFKKLNIFVPKDVYLCGFDDSSESRIVTPPLTTIHIHTQIMGFSAVHLLISRIKEPWLHYRTVHTETSLIYRESTEN